MIPNSEAQQQAARIEHVCRAAMLAKTARVVFVGTQDREQALTLAETAAAAAGVRLHHITPAGTRRRNTAHMRWEDVRSSDQTPDDMLDEAITMGGIVVMEEFVGHVKDGSAHVKARVKLASLLDRRDYQVGLLLLLVDAPEAENHLPSMLSGQIVKVHIGYPHIDELVAMVRALTAIHAQRAGRQLDIATIRAHALSLATGLVGLTRKAAEDALNDTLVACHGDQRAAAALLEAHKVDRLSRELSMEIITDPMTEMPAGMEKVVQFLEINHDRIRQHGKERARGILMIGPPGTGKTMCARAAGAKLGLPVVFFRVSALMNSLVGETERLFAKAFATLAVMAPCVVFIDELEKMFGESTTERDGGTMMRATGSLLSWLSDNEQPNFIVATSNDLSRMGSIGLTMTRSERFETAFFVDVPATAARETILLQALQAKTDHAQPMAQVLARETEQFSGADLFSLVKHADAIATYHKTPLSLDLLRKEAERKRPRVAAMYKQFAELRRWGNINCEPAGLTQ